MFRRLLLSLACLGAALVWAAAPLPARAQDRQTLDRLDRLERDLNMLQRQVYRGAPTTATTGDAGQAASVEIRMERLESQMRDLTGRVEEFANQVAQLRQRLEQINSDIDVRLGQGGGGPGPVAAATHPGPRPARCRHSRRRRPPNTPVPRRRAGRPTGTARAAPRRSSTIMPSGC